MTAFAQVETLARARRLAASGEGRRIRQAADLSIAEIARAVGVTQPVVNNWELGRRRPQGAPAARWVALLERLAAMTAEPGAPAA